MISYKPLFETLKQKGVSEYNLIYKQGISANTLYRMHHGMTVTTKTIDTLCYILGCTVSDVVEFRDERKD